MEVIKRTGKKQKFDINKIKNRLIHLSKFPYEINDIDIDLISNKIKNGLYKNISTIKIDEYSSIICISLIIKNYNYGILASRIIINNHHKKTLSSFKDKMDKDDRF